MYNKKTWHYYASFYKDKWGRVLAVFSLSILQSLAVFPVLFLAKRIVDTVIPAGSIQDLIQISSIILVLIAFTSILKYLTSRTALMINSSIIRELRFDLINRYYSLPLSNIIKADKGKFHTVFLADVGRIESMGSMFISAILPAAFATCVLISVLIYLSWKLSLILVVLFPLIAFTTQRMGLGIKEKVDLYRKSFQDLSKRMFFVLWMAELTRLQTAEAFENDRQSKGLLEFQEKAVSMSLEQSKYNILQGALAGFIGIIILVFGGIAVFSNTMSLGDLVSFYLAARLLQGYSNPLLSAVPAIIAGNEALTAISDTLGVENLNLYSGSEEVDFDGSVSLNNVTFGYDRDTVLQNASMELKSGSTVAVLGPNGAGKSTITNLILGFYKPSEGEITVQGRSYETLSLSSLRKKIGVVPQSPLFFKGTIYENIIYGLPDATREDVEKVSKQVGCHDFISKLPDGYETSLADAGALISGGERQLIAICRAFLRSPNLLILDEPTNHLSKKAVKDLFERLKQDQENRTTLIISHHWEVAQIADRTYYLEARKLRQVELSELPQLESRLTQEV